MILIIDDDRVVRSSLTLLLRRAGYQVEAVEGPTSALNYIEKQTPSLILMDMNFSLTTTGEEGLGLLASVKRIIPNVPIILITAWGTIDLAVRGMQAGAFDFIPKPWDNRRMLQAVATALELSTQENQDAIPDTRKLLDAQYNFKHIIGYSKSLVEVLKTVARIAPTNASVLITGESGTGKELIAEAIHQNSRRKSEAFIKVNLGGISQSLFESEMFGHKKGAFTDAHINRVGRFEMADKGTIFLDEIGDLDATCQVKLLRVLQDQTFEVLGDSKPQKVDVRVVSATNADLKQMVANGSFREDLFYRINLITIHVPSLRERPEDIPLLADHFANRLCSTNGLPMVRFTDKAYALLQRQSFPGNIRELKNLVDRTILVSGKEVIDEQDFDIQLNNSEVEEELPQDLTLEQLEEQMIRIKIKQFDGNLSQVAAVLGISRGALYRRLEKYDIKV